MTATQLSTLLDSVIEREGGYSNDPRDPGGETKYGISKRRFPNEDIKNLTVERAKELYLEHYVKPYRIDEFENAQLAEVVFDWCVNGGPAIKELQKLLGVSVDGIIGAETITAANSPLGKAVFRPYLYARLFYFVALTKHPFIKGWVRRLIGLGL